MKLDLKRSHPDWYRGAYARSLALFEQREFYNTSHNLKSLLRCVTGEY